MRKCDKDIIDAAFALCHKKVCEDLCWDCSNYEAAPFSVSCIHAKKCATHQLEIAVKKHPNFKKK